MFLKLGTVILLVSAVSCADLKWWWGNILEVTTDKGVVRGEERTTVTTGKVYYAFEGIPYAKPPINKLRFEPPQAPDKWTDILEANNSKSFCIETSRIDGKPIYSEDCLYLDIYTPTLNKNLLPVVVYLFGEGFTAGQIVSKNAQPDFILDEDVIYVTLKYRLGIFGFISTGDSVAPGNLGLKDQILALQWVKNNIYQFGGDPNKVTLAGVGGGAMSVSWLQQSKLAEGLFSKTILESGTSLSLWALSDQVTTLTTDIAQHLKVDTTCSQSIVEGLKAIDAYTLQETSHALWDNYFNNNPLNSRILAPVIEPEHDGAVITKSGYDALTDGDIIKVPSIIGYNSEEGNNEALSGYFMVNCLKYDLFSDMLIPPNMNVEGFFARKTVGNHIKGKYFGIVPACLNHGVKAKVFGDTEFVRPIRETVRLQSTLAPVYFYRFGFSGNWNILNSDSREVNYAGAAHYEELPYIFYSSLCPGVQATDEAVRSRMLKMWTNFIKTGNPTPSADSLLQNIIWPAVSNQNSIQYLDINTDLQIQVNPDSDVITFWQDLYNTYAKPPQSTY